MNKKQKIILWCGAILACIMIAFPPWLKTDGLYPGAYDFGYSFIATPATKEQSYEKYKYMAIANEINISRLILQIAIVAILTGTGIATVQKAR